MGQTDEIVTYIQEHCLWQFFSRTWDRENNIQNVLSLTFKILTGEPFKCETADDRCHFANANSLAAEMKEALPWLEELPKKDLVTVISRVKASLEDITVKHSLNAELNQPTY